MNKPGITPVHWVPFWKHHYDKTRSVDSSVKAALPAVQLSGFRGAPTSSLPIPSDCQLF